MADIAITPEVGWAILSLLVGAIAAAAWMFVVAVLRYLGEQERWQWAEGFVRATEQMLAGQDGQAKREWVIAQLTARFPKLDATTIRTMLEDAVSRVKQGATS